MYRLVVIFQVGQLCNQAFFYLVFFGHAVSRAEIIDYLVNGLGYFDYELSCYNIF